MRYEDLVLDPETTLREVFSWLDEPWSDRLLEHHLVHSERGTPSKVEGASRSDDPIDPSRISAWTEKVSDDDIAVMRKRVGGLASFYGYDLDDVDTFTPMTAPGSERKKTLTGTDLAKRRAEFPELVELDKVNTPWVGNQMLTPEAIGIVAPKKKKAEKKVAKKAAPPAAAARPTTTAARARRAVGRTMRAVAGKVDPAGR